jgi:hypothetical protein
MQLGIPRIQKALTDGTIDDALIYSVFLAAYLHLITGELASCRRHLEGLHQLLQRYQATAVDGQFVINPPPEMMLVWRMAVRMDHTWAMGDQNSVFPPVAPQDDLHRRWVQTMVDYDKVEWALAMFALDDLFTRAIAVMKNAIHLRAEATDHQSIETTIKIETTKLFDELQVWLNRPCIQTATALAEVEQRMLSDVGLTLEDTNIKFLHYPPFKVSNNIYGALMIQYYWTMMYITFITHPKPGPHPSGRRRAAISLCRTYAGLGGVNAIGVSRMVLGLYIAGLTLGEPMYPTGTSREGF